MLTYFFIECLTKQHGLWVYQFMRVWKTPVRNIRVDSDQGSQILITISRVICVCTGFELHKKLRTEEPCFHFVCTYHTLHSRPIAYCHKVFLCSTSSDWLGSGMVCSHFSSAAWALIQSPSIYQVQLCLGLDSYF